MDNEAMLSWLERHADISFSRSSGPGGQNVNKVNSKTTLRVNLALIDGLSAEERSRLLEKLGPRLVGGSTAPDGSFAAGTELIIQVQDERSQLQNRELAIERALAVIVKGLHRDKPRRATKPTKASKERRIIAKKRISARKGSRSNPVED